MSRSSATASGSACSAATPRVLGRTVTHGGRRLHDRRRRRARIVAARCRPTSYFPLEYDRHLRRRHACKARRSEFLSVLARAKAGRRCGGDRCRSEARRRAAAERVSRIERRPDLREQAAARHDRRRRAAAAAGAARRGGTSCCSSRARTSRTCCWRAARRGTASCRCARRSAPAARG